MSILLLNLSLIVSISFITNIYTLLHFYIPLCILSICSFEIAFLLFFYCVFVIILCYVFNRFVLCLCDLFHIQMLHQRAFEFMKRNCMYACMYECIYIGMCIYICRCVYVYMYL
jgi:hypothetical protein